VTTDPRRIAVALALLAGLTLVHLGGCTSGRAGRRGGLPKATVATYPPDIQAAYELFAVRCSRCHTLSRPLNAAIYDHEHWENYVGRMRRHAGSGISPKDAEQILVFLRFYADRRAEAANPTRSSTVAGATP